MSVVEVRKIAGDNCITLDQGEPVFTAVRDLLRGGQRVQLDFEGVAFCASPFLNSAVGRLLKEFTLDDLRQRLSIQHLNTVGLQLLRRVMENSNVVFNDPDARAALQRILDEDPESGGKTVDR
jgi:hypothetical protein